MQYKAFLARMCSCHPPPPQSPPVITAFSPPWSRCSCQGTLQHAAVKHLVVVVIVVVVVFVVVVIIVIEIVVLLVIVIVVTALKKASNILLSNMFVFVVVQNVVAPVKKPSTCLMPLTICVWKRLLPKEIEDGSHGIMEYILTWCNHSTPSISGEGKSASGHLVDSIKELAFMRIRDNLPKSWPVASPSFTPLHLASAVAINLT